jgi:dihydropteroate synthase
MVGTSRKSFLGGVLAAASGGTRAFPPEHRDDATLASVVWALDAGARVVRVHDVRPAARAVALLRVLEAAAA